MDGGWHQPAPGGHVFDVGLAFSDADVDHLTDLLLFEELLDPEQHGVAAGAHPGDFAFAGPVHGGELHAPSGPVVCLPQSRTQTLSGMPFAPGAAALGVPASLQQQHFHSAFAADGSLDPTFGLMSAGFGAGSVAEQELLVSDASELGGGKRRRAVDRRGARSTSKYRGVTHHCRTGRWEAHLWQNARQVYLGGFDAEEQAALAYDIAAIKCRGRDAQTNFPLLSYEQELDNLERVSTEELVLSLRRQSKGFTRGTSKFRGVTRHQKGRWEARIGQLTGRKYRYLGLFDSEVEAAVAYDREAVRQRGLDACTNFELSGYADVLAQSLPEMQDGGANSAALRAATAPSASALSADASDGAATSAQLRLPGPAIAVEPSAEAVAAVQALFARQPQLVAAAGMQQSVDVAAAATPRVEHDAFSPAAVDARASSGGMKRQRLESAALCDMYAAAAEQACAGFAATPDVAPAAPPCGDAAAAHPSTPQQTIPRRTSAPM